FGLNQFRFVLTIVQSREDLTLMNGITLLDANPCHDPEEARADLDSRSVDDVATDGQHGGIRASCRICGSRECIGGGARVRDFRCRSSPSAGSHDALAFMCPRPGQIRGDAEHSDNAEDNELEGLSGPAFELRLYLQGF